MKSDIVSCDYICFCSGCNHWFEEKKRLEIWYDLMLFHDFCNLWFTGQFVFTDWERNM
uniref:Uncharacterized protein n=1 Tax=Rhizophora mucronata TaxID=61149 RepID=A0A2P2PSF5_RHIMU